MNDEPPAWVRETLSMPRFGPYLATADGDVDAAIWLYWWNIEVSAAFYVPLHCLELALRNALHEKLSTRFGRDDWWGAAPLSDHGRRIVASAVQTVARRGGRPHVADDVVAELSFGFWVSLISRGVSYDRTLWVPTLHLAFPFFRGRRRKLHEDFVSMLLLRNRIMHHEPIHYRNLPADHAKIYRLLGYISPTMVAELLALDQVGDILRRRGEM